MKPWLLNVLACPIDKHHPLEAYFFKWETSDEELEKRLKNAENEIKNEAKYYDYTVINKENKLDETIDKIVKILKKEGYNIE